MSEIRLNPITGEWVIIAPERGQRPHESSEPQEPAVAPSPAEDCPFCPGNEAMTPAPVLEVPAGEGRNWRVRVFPNRYSALEPTPPPMPAPAGPLFVALAGKGVHEVIVETPVHDRVPSLMSDEEVAVAVQACHERYRALAARASVRYVLIFKNQGEAAGTSIQHPHSQIIAAPVVPAAVRRRCEIAGEHHQRSGRCLHCDIVQEELRLDIRVVYQNGRFMVFHPFASSHPAETWIVPLEHAPSFAQVNKEDLTGFASVLGRTLRALKMAFGDPDFNYAIHSAPPEDERRPYLHWYLQLIPRLTKTAGFELGAGMGINPAAPEDTARLMRQADS